MYDRQLFLTSEQLQKQYHSNVCWGYNVLCMISILLINYLKYNIRLIYFYFDIGLYTNNIK